LTTRDTSTMTSVAHRIFNRIDRNMAPPKY
jgi:hypothetical protein